MGIYGVDFYGTALYGLQVADDSLSVAPFRVTPRGYGTLVVQWHLPDQSLWTRLRLIRNAYGYPMEVDEREIVLDSLTPVNEYEDSGLTEGRWYYYTLFFLDTSATPQWKRVGVAAGLVTVDYRSSELLFKSLPLVYQEADMNAEVVPVVNGPVFNNPLQHFFGIIGYELDIWRTYISSANTHDVSYVPLPLIQQLVEEFGATFETEMGVRLIRLFLANLVYLYKIKGTRLGIEGVASSVTGFDCTVLDTMNLLVSNNDSTFESGVGNWVAISNCAVASIAEGTQPEGSKALRITMSANASGTVQSCATASVLTHGIPVKPGRAYYFRAQIKSNSTYGKTVRIIFDWYGADGALISSSANNDATDQTAWTERTALDGAPPGAVRLIMRLVAVSGATSEVRWIDKAQVFELYNLLPAAAAEMSSTAMWTASANTSVAQVNKDQSPLEQAIALPYSLKLTRTGSTGTAEITLTTKVSSVPKASSASGFVAWVFIRPASTTRTVTITLDKYDVTQLSSPSDTVTASVAETGGTWVCLPLLNTTVSPLGGYMFLRLKVSFASCAAGESHYVGFAGVGPHPNYWPYVSPGGIFAYLKPSRMNLAGDTFLVAGASVAHTTGAPIKYGTTKHEVTSQGGSYQVIYWWVPVKAGQAYYFSGYARAATNGRTIRPYATWQDQNGSTVSSLSYGASFVDSSSDWVRISGRWTAPATAFACIFGFEIASAPNNEVHYFNGVMVEATDALDDYFDGTVGMPDRSGGLSADFLWEGAVTQSRSYYYPRRSTKNARLAALLAEWVPVGVEASIKYEELSFQ